MEKETGFFEHAGAKLYYEAAGEGIPVVFIHAGVADSRQWENEFIKFSASFRVLRYDLRGYGKSVPVEGEYSNMEDLIALLDFLDFTEPIVMIGCSMGGGLALDFTLTYPSRVEALVTLGSGPSGLQLDVPDHPREEEAEQAYKQGELDLLAELEAQIWFDGMGRTKEQVDPEMRALAVEMNRLALSHDALHLGKRLRDTDTPAVDRLDELNIPVLVMVGEHDLPYCLAAADYLVNHLPDARKVILEDAAHLANLEHPDQFEKAALSFLESLP